MEKSRIASTLELAEEIGEFRFCGPSDDPDEQTAVVYGFKHLAKQFIGRAKRIQNIDFQESLKRINTDIENIYDAYDLRSDLQVVIDQLREIDEHTGEWQNLITDFVAPSIIEQLRTIQNANFDTAKIARLCEELNSSFSMGNYIAAVLLIRTLINHIPPIFGKSSFNQVVSQSTKSRKDLFSPLEEYARKVGDLHAHDLIRHKESLPTKNQIEPFKPSIEVLLQEIIVEMAKPPSVT